jgi:hypothetical protein
MTPRRTALSLVLLLLAGPLHAQVLINEIFYHAPNDLTDLQWIELHNPTDSAVGLAGWSFSKGVKFTFAEGVSIAPHGYVVICKNRERFRQFYDVPVAGEFEKSIKRSGERLELRNAAGDLVDTVTFGDRPPWPTSPDGWSASLERICPTAPSGVPENWAASPLSDDATKPGGTPGTQNGCFAASLPPVISDVSFKPICAEPGQVVTVQADVQSECGLREVTLRYRVVGPGFEGEEASLPMTKGIVSRRYSATIPGQKAGQIVRFRIHAIDQQSAQRFFPGENEPRPALSCLVATNVAPGKIPFACIIHTDEAQFQSAQRQRRGPGGGPGGPFDEENMGRMMAEMQFRSALDLSELWVALTLSNAPATDLERLRPVFARKSIERDQLEAKTLASTNLQETVRKLPDVVKSFTASLGDDLRPLLRAEQTKVFEAWRDRAPAGGGPFGFGGNPAMMLRQFLRLEPAYFYLSTHTEVTAAQFASVREVYRNAIQQRDALAKEVPAFTGPPMGEDDKREEFQAKLEAVGADVERKLKEMLTPGQARQLAAWRAREQPGFMRRGAAKAPKPAQGKSAFVFVDPQSRAPKLFDFVHVTQRSGGHKVHFGKDQPLDGMPVINLVFKMSDRWALTEPLAYELYRRAGLAVCRTDFVRLWIDGEPLGYHFLFEQPTKAFLRRVGLHDNGNLYKANWTGRGLVGQNVKKSNRQAGPDDLVQLVKQLEKTKANPAEQWELIKREFDVEEMLTHYAVRMLLSDWDGFFNNYYLYHDLTGTKKWTLYPWDQDQTWGDPGMGTINNLLYNMPLTFGAEGDKPSGWKGDKPPTGFLGPGMGGAMWWRPGGYVSKPLLANPTFRKLFLARLKELLGSEFTEDRLFPLVDQLRDRLQDEVRFRAEASKEDPNRAQQRFESNLASLKEFVTKRRQWLLEQAEIRTAGAFDRTQVK